MRARLVEAGHDRLEVAVRSGGEAPRTLWYRSRRPVWDEVPSTHEFVAVALAQCAAASGEDLLVEGPVRTGLLDQLQEYLSIWASWRPDRFAAVRVAASEEVPDDVPAPAGRARAVMGFSGGVDASFALAAHASGAPGRLTSPIGLGVLVIGWDVRHADEVGRRVAAETASRSLRAYGASCAVVATNWQQDFCPAWFLMFNAGLVGLLHTFAATHAGAVYANDLAYEEELGRGPYGGRFATNRLLGHPSFPVRTTGGSHRRIERVAFLADHPALVANLRVCFQEGAAGKNCGRCEKCVRTQLELRAAGIVGPELAAAFPTPMGMADLHSASTTNTAVMSHYEDIAAALPPGDEYVQPTRAWARRHRQAHAERLGLPMARVAALERQRRDLRAELDDLRASTSWRVSKPIRTAARTLRTTRRAGQ